MALRRKPERSALFNRHGNLRISDNNLRSCHRSIPAGEQKKRRVEQRGKSKSLTFFDISLRNWIESRTVPSPVIAWTRFSLLAKNSSIIFTAWIDCRRTISACSYESSSTIVVTESLSSSQITERNESKDQWSSSTHRTNRSEEWWWWIELVWSTCKWSEDSWRNNSYRERRNEERLRSRSTARCSKYPEKRTNVVLLNWKSNAAFRSLSPLVLVSVVRPIDFLINAFYVSILSYRRRWPRRRATTDRRHSNSQSVTTVRSFDFRIRSRRSETTETNRSITVRGRRGSTNLPANDALDFCFVPNESMISVRVDKFSVERRR